MPRAFGGVPVLTVRSAIGTTIFRVPTLFEDPMSLPRWYWIVVLSSLAATPLSAEGRPLDRIRTATDSVRDGRDVLGLMHERYAASWYETLALIQSVTHFDSAGGIDHAEVWYESLELPGKVRSDIAPLDDGRGELFRTDSVFRFEGDTVVQRGSAVHVILLLGFDVYRQPVETTVRTLERYGFDLNGVRSGEWEERPVWIVGAESGPTAWIDQEDLLLRRLVVPSRRDGRRRDIRFRGYEPLGGGWIATELEFLMDGVLQIRETYAWWDIGLTFDASLFGTAGRTRPDWVRN